MTCKWCKRRIRDVNGNYVSDHTLQESMGGNQSTYCRVHDDNRPYSGWEHEPEDEPSAV